MAEVKATVFWDPKAQRVTKVQPDRAKLKRATNDTLRWGLDNGGDASAQIADIVFQKGGPMGPFNQLNKSPGGQQWLGSNLKPDDGVFKYDVTVTSNGGGDTLDPDVEVGPGP
jgi:hypothetical protein